MHYRTGLSHYFGGNAIYLEYIVYCIPFYCILFRALFTRGEISRRAEISRLDYSGIATLGHAHRIITYLIILWARWGTYPSNGLVRSLPITSRDSWFMCVNRTNSIISVTNSLSGSKKSFWVIRLNWTIFWPWQTKRSGQWRSHKFIRVLYKCASLIDVTDVR